MSGDERKVRMVIGRKRARPLVNPGSRAHLPLRVAVAVVKAGTDEARAA